ncbi:MAG TPA: type IX secretion system membrane protein PorP/SprF [Bacteroidales bacterium]|nr:type IX secretion system membrane protein PorP/SprF [Bacteroidales bacterium]
MKRIRYISILFLIAASSYAQQNSQYNQYIFNELVINPAYAGTKEIINANAIISKQWAGLDGSPTTQSIGIEGPFTNKVGLGIHVVNDKIGAQSQQSIFGSYSYKLQVNAKYKLALGLAVGASNFSIDGTKLTTTTQDDPAVPKTLENKILLDAKTGLFFYSDRFYAGFSVADLLANVFKNQPYYVDQVRHYYLTSGYVFDVLPKLKFKPSFLFKHAYKSPSNIDLNAFFLYNQKFWLGCTYRFGSMFLVNESLTNSLKKRDALVIMTEYNVNDKFRIGYAYTITTSVLKNYMSHELSLGYFIPGKTPIKKMNNIRYF